MEDELQSFSSPGLTALFEFLQTHSDPALVSFTVLGPARCQLRPKSLLLHTDLPCCGQVLSR